MLEMIAFPAILVLGLTAQLWAAIGPAGMFLLVLGLTWSWDQVN